MYLVSNGSKSPDALALGMRSGGNLVFPGLNFYPTHRVERP